MSRVLLCKRQHMKLVPHKGSLEGCVWPGARDDDAAGETQECMRAGEVVTRDGSESQEERERRVYTCVRVPVLSLVMELGCVLV